MADTISVGIIGDFDPNRKSHQATNNALHHAAAHLSTKLDIRWLPTESLIEAEYKKKLEQFDALWAAPGSPVRSLEGALNGIRFAREMDRPFLGT
jgi:CTP synthase (UTP-ammonia lyase)